MDDATDEDRERMVEAARNLQEEVLKLAEAGSSDAPPKVRLRIGKGTRPSLTFESDGSTVPLPAFPFATAD